jgi:hypothetical protein
MDLDGGTVRRREGYRFTSRGELILSLDLDGGAVIFR